MSIFQAWTPKWSGSSDIDSAAVRKAKLGDKSAFDKLRIAHENQLRGYVLRRSSAEGLDDLMQEIWIACWQALPRYAGKATFKTWLYGIASHKCTDYLRVKIQNDGRTQDLDCDELIQPDAYHTIDMQESLRTALAKVPDSQREILELYYYAELTLAEIAKALDKNLNTVKYQFYRAHDLVAQQLKAEDSDKK